MIALLSPAKKLNLEPVSPALPSSTPALWAESQRMMTKAKNLSRKKLRELMHISQDLAELNWKRHNSFEVPFTPENAKQAILTFDGDVYFGLDAATLDGEALQWAQENVGLLSGMFGILRPLDLVQPYRLEMGTAIPSRRGKNLYDFWGESVTKRLNEMTERQVDRTIVNVASNEYSSVVRAEKLKGGMVTIVFKEIKEEGPKTIGTVAKRSRGKFVRWMIDERVETREGLKAFDVADYAFDPALSTGEVYTFTRAHVESRMKAEFQERKLRDQGL